MSCTRSLRGRYAVRILTTCAIVCVGATLARGVEGGDHHRPRRWVNPPGQFPSPSRAVGHCETPWGSGASVAAHLRGGAEDDSAFTLFLRIFLPRFGLGDKEGALDLASFGLAKRVQRFFSELLRPLVGGKKKANTGGAAGTGKGGGTKSGKPSAMKEHLDTSYRPGNANYRIQKELKAFIANPPDNCKVSVGKSIRVWIITIVGAEGTIFAGEKFRLRVEFPPEYPTKPPKVYFLLNPPPPKHQHIYTNGDICLSLLGRDWKASLTVESLAVSILSMLSSAKEKQIPQDNAGHANAKPGQAQDNWMYHDDTC